MKKRTTERSNLNDSRIFQFVFVLVVLAAGLPVWGQTFDEKFEHWPVELKIRGTVVAGTIEDASILKQVGLQDSQPVKILTDGKAPGNFVEDMTSILEWTKAQLSLEQPGLTSQVKVLLKDCGIFCWYRKAPFTPAQREAVLACRDAFRRHVDSGGTIVLLGAASSCVGAKGLSATDGTFAADKGLGLIPDGLLLLGYEGTDQHKNALLGAVAANPGTVGMGLTNDAVVILSGRKIQVAGPGSANFFLSGTIDLPESVQTISQRRSRRQPADDYLLDLTQWRRGAIDRTLAPFPPAKPARPFVKHGTLMIVGGGGLPAGLMNDFVELAGGKRKAKLVYIPCSERDDVSQRQSMVESWKRMGVQHASFVHTKDRVKANSDEEFLAPLVGATGIWFGGGRQWNFADSYYGTQAHKLMKQVLARGGVIGGSSAGASIQPRYLARATPIGNYRIMAPGYERGGLGFISGVAIDQHFSQRNRQKDMSQLVDRYPQLLGIGIDETTAVIVQKSMAKVVGRGQVYFYDRTRASDTGERDYVTASAGEEYDLANREKVESEPQTD